MPITKTKKVALTKSFAEMIDGAQSVVFVSFNKLTVADSNAFRRSLQVQNVGYKVVKKTLLKRALDAKGFAGEMPELPGEIAMAYASDLLAPAREVYAFQKDHKEVMQIVGGVFEGKYLSKDAMLSIATIPPLQVLYGQFVNLINSPIQRFAVVLDAIAQAKA